MSAGAASFMSLAGQDRLQSYFLQVSDRKRGASYGIHGLIALSSFAPFDFYQDFLGGLGGFSFFCRDFGAGDFVGKGGLAGGDMIDGPGAAPPSFSQAFGQGLFRGSEDEMLHGDAFLFQGADDFVVVLLDIDRHRHEDDAFIVLGNVF